MRQGTSLFGYYGSKSKLINLYPAPAHHTIVEPFAGGACYALRYWDHDVWLNDLNPHTMAAWRFLQRPDAADIVARRIPCHIDAWTPLSDLIRDDDHSGFVEIVRAGCARGWYGMKGTRRTVSPMGAPAWSARANGAGGYRNKLLTWIPRIAHWTLTTLSYDQLPNIRATWFVDPPYNNAAGKKYATSCVNYTHLATWCRSREGQTIACENAGADWLPFTTLTTRRRGIHYGSVDEHTAGEVVWMQETEPIGLWAIREPDAVVLSAARC